MAKRKEVEVLDDLDGTVEGLARDHFEREKAAYEERTGTKVEYVPPMPLTRTPIKEVESGESRVESTESEDAAGSDDQENKSAEGVE